MSDTQFIEGLNFKAPHPKAPDFVKAQGGMRREALIAWLQQQQGEWVNFDVKEGRSGKWYACVNDYKRDAEPRSKPVKDCSQPDQGGFEDDDPNSIPF